MHPFSFLSPHDPNGSSVLVILQGDVMFGDIIDKTAMLADISNKGTKFLRSKTRCNPRELRTSLRKSRPRVQTDGRGNMFFRKGDKRITPCKC